MNNFVSYLNLIFVITGIYIEANKLHDTHGWWMMTVILLIFPLYNFIFLNDFIREKIDNNNFFPEIGDIRGGAYWHYSEEEKEFLQKHGESIHKEGKKIDFQLRDGHGIYFTNICGFIGFGIISIMDLKNGWESASNEQLFWYTAPILSMLNFISIQTAWYSKPVYTRNRYLPRS